MAAAESCLDAALGYAARGWAVLPVKARDKAPLTAHGVHDASSDQATIQEWWNKWPGANVAIACGSISKLVVLDVDGHQGRKSLRALENQFGPLPKTRRVKTGDGEHIYFRFTESQRTRQVAPGLQLRGKDHYVLAPPSVHPTGVRYEVLNDLKLAPLPDALRDLTSAGPALGPAPEINTNGPPQLSKRVRQLTENDPDVKLRWNGDTLGLNDRSRSGLDLSLVSLLVHRDCTDAEIADVLWLAPYNTKRQPELTPQYLARTITRARSDKSLGQAAITMVVESATATPATPISLAECKSQIARWLAFARGEDLLIDVALATKLANDTEGDPVFLVIVGPSSGAKSEVLRAFRGISGVHMLGSLTARTFASGLDPKKASLLTQLEGVHTLVVKDLGTILAMNPNEKGDLLQQLRDIFDGYFRRDWGSNKGPLEWSGRLGLLAGATPAIEREFGTLAALGERFLFFRISVLDRGAQARRALEVAGQETVMRKEIHEAIAAVLAGISAEKVSAVSIPPEMIDAIELISCVATQARTPVVRDRYDKTVDFLPALEGPARMAKQLKKLGQALAALYEHVVVGGDEIRVLARIGVHSIPSNRARAISCLALQDDSWITSKRAGEELNVPTATASRILEDLTVLGMVERRARGEQTQAQFEARLAPAFARQWRGLAEHVHLPESAERVCVAIEHKSAESGW